MQNFNIYNNVAIMRTFLLLLFFCVGFACSYAQEDVYVTRLHELTTITGNTVGGASPLADKIRQEAFDNLRGKKNFEDEVETYLMATILEKAVHGSKEYLDAQQYAVIDVYKEHLTLEDLEAIIALYSSPAAKTAIDNVKKANTSAVYTSGMAKLAVDVALSLNGSKTEDIKPVKCAESYEKLFDRFYEIYVKSAEDELYSTIATLAADKLDGDDMSKLNNVLDHLRQSITSSSKILMRNSFVKNVTAKDLNYYISLIDNPAFVKYLSCMQKARQANIALYKLSQQWLDDHADSLINNTLSITKPLATILPNVTNYNVFTPSRYKDIAKKNIGSLFSSMNLPNMNVDINKKAEASIDNFIHSCLAMYMAYHLKDEVRNVVTDEELQNIVQEAKGEKDFVLIDKIIELGNALTSQRFESYLSGNSIHVIDMVASNKKMATNFDKSTSTIQKKLLEICPFLYKDENTEEQLEQSVGVIDAYNWSQAKKASVKKEVKRVLMDVWKQAVAEIISKTLLPREVERGCALFQVRGVDKLPELKNCVDCKLQADESVLNKKTVRLMMGYICRHIVDETDTTFTHAMEECLHTPILRNMVLDRIASVFQIKTSLAEEMGDARFTPALAEDYYRDEVVYADLAACLNGLSKVLSASTLAGFKTLHSDPRVLPAVRHLNEVFATGSDGYKQMRKDMGRYSSVKAKKCDENWKRLFDEYFASLTDGAKIDLISRLDLQTKRPEILEAGSLANAYNGIITEDDLRVLTEINKSADSNQVMKSVRGCDWKILKELMELKCAGRCILLSKEVLTK